MSLLQPAKRQCNAACAEHCIACKYMACSGCMKWKWPQVKVGKGNAMGRSGLHFVKAKKESSLS